MVKRLPANLRSCTIKPQLIIQIIFCVFEKEFTEGRHLRNSLASRAHIGGLVRATACLVFEVQSGCQRPADSASQVEEAVCVKVCFYKFCSTDNLRGVFLASGVHIQQGMIGKSTLPELRTYSLPPVLELELLNTTPHGITFTMETAAENKITFLDVLINKLPSGTFETSVYKKATHADIVLDYNSNSPASHKRSCVTELLGRIVTNCSNAKVHNLRETTSTDFSTALVTRLISSSVPNVTGTVNLLLLPRARGSTQHGEPYVMSKTSLN